MTTTNRRNFMKGATGVAIAASASACSTESQQSPPSTSAAAAGPTTALTPSAVQSGDWRETYAYTLGVQAYVFGFPWVFLPQVRHDWVTQPRNPDWVPYAALNHFWHAKRLANADYRDGGSPNNDTLYSMAWLDLRGGPVVLSHSDMGDRYFTFEIGDMSSDNVAYVGSRTTGARAGSYAIVQEGWKGGLPNGVKQLEPSSSPYALIIGRTLINGPDDVPTSAVSRSNTP